MVLEEEDVLPLCGDSVGGDGSSNSGESVKTNITNSIRDDIKSLQRKIVGELKGEPGKEIWTGDVSRKVFIE